MIFIDYLSWHYGAGFRDTMRRAGLLVTGIANLFSIGPLIETLFSPWHGIIDPYQFKGGLGIADFFYTLGMNLISRMIGAILRAVVIAIGLVSLALALVSAAIWVALWVLFPAAIPSLIFWGIFLIVS